MKGFRVAAVALLSLALAGPAVADRDHLICYKSKDASVVKFPGASTHLDDDNGTEVPGAAHTFFLKKSKDICETVDFGSASAIDTDDKWVFYPGKRAKGECDLDASVACKSDGDCGGSGPCILYTEKFDKKATKNRSKRVVDDFVDIRLDFAKEIGALVPTSLGITGPSAGTEEYYKCYAVKATKESCVGGINDGLACKGSNAPIDCPMGACVKNLKFPKELFLPDGLVTETIDANLLSGDTEFQFKKLKMVCQATDRDGEGVLESQAAVLCYQGKATKDDDNPDFIAPGPQTATNALQTAPFDVKKPDLLCNPACIEPGAPVFTTFSARANALSLANSGHDLSILAGFVNDALADAVTDGSINLLFALDSFGDGSHIVSGYTGDLDSPAGCANINDGAQTCNYVVDESSLEVDTLDSCIEEAFIQLPVTLAGTGTAPSATANGGGPGTKFTVNFAFGDATLTLTADNVTVATTLTHDTADFSVITGSLTGAVLANDLRKAIAELDGSCEGGMDDGASCTADSQCSNFCCELIPDDGGCGMSPEELAPVVAFLPANVDLDGQKNCLFGTNDNEICTTIADCPDQASDGVLCKQEEAMSLIINFNAIDAEITGVAD